VIAEIASSRPTTQRFFLDLEKLGKLAFQHALDRNLVHG